MKKYFLKKFKPFTGTINEYYDNGKTKMEMFVSKGLKHGSFNQFHSNGNLQTQSNFIKGEIHGKFTSYHEKVGMNRLLLFITTTIVMEVMKSFMKTEN